MLLIHCPICEEARPELEFRQSGEAHMTRPEGLGAFTDRQVAEMLYFRSNERGLVFERWRHVHGCGRFFNAVRHSVTDKFVATYKAGLPKPQIDADGRVVLSPEADEADMAIVSPAVLVDRDANTNPDIAGDPADAAVARTEAQQ